MVSTVVAGELGATDRPLRHILLPVEHQSDQRGRIEEIHLTPPKRVGRSGFRLTHLFALPLGPPEFVASCSIEYGEAGFAAPASGTGWQHRRGRPKPVYPDRVRQARDRATRSPEIGAFP